MTSGLPSKPASVARNTRNLFEVRIWHHSALEDQTPRGRTYALLRILHITTEGTLNNKIFSGAAALAYSSLLSLGPIISLAIIIASFVLQKNSDAFATNTLDKLVSFIAPSTAEYSRVERDAAATDQQVDDMPDLSVQPMYTVPADAPAHPSKNINPKIVEFLNHIVVSAQSKTLGVVGLLILVFICIQLIISIETTFNTIWGVRRGRNLLHRVVLYWTVFSLGALMGFTAGTLLSAAALGKMMKNLPWGLNVLGAYNFLPETLSFIALSLLLAVFYKFIPNTTVRWKPALIGGFVTALCLTLNNYLSFFYVRQVLSAQSLYGSIGIIPVLLFGLYVFWLLVLLGGQLTYAIQHANFLTGDRIWNMVSQRVRRLLSIGVFMQTARAFIRHEQAPSSDELAKKLRAPGRIVNECITRLCDAHLLSPIDDSGDPGHHLTRYQPGQPLHELTLGSFNRAMDKVGNNEGGEVLTAAEPALREFVRALEHFENEDVMNRSFAELLAPPSQQPGVAK